MHKPILMKTQKDSVPTVESLERELSRLRLVFGCSLLAIALVLIIVLPSVIWSAAIRVSNEPDTRGPLMYIVEAISGTGNDSESMYESSYEEIDETVETGEGESAAAETNEG